VTIEKLIEMKINLFLSRIDNAIFHIPSKDLILIFKNITKKGKQILPQTV